MFGRHIWGTELSVNVNTNVLLVDYFSIQLFRFHTTSDTETGPMLASEEQSKLQEF